MSVPVDAATRETREPVGSQECPRCGSTVAPMQEYCLECGAALPAAAPPRPRSGVRAWAWSALVTALVAAVAAGVVVAARAVQEDGADRAALTATQPTPTGVETAAAPAETAEAPPTEPAAETEPEAATPPPANEVIAWPRGARGWTVILASVPTERGRPGATRRAKEAARGGLTQVGVLESASFSSLHPGYFVVFSGVYDSQGQAEQAVALARDRGFDAYPREIVP